MKISFSKTATRDVTRTAAHLRDQAGDAVANRSLQSLEDRLTMLQNAPDARRIMSRSGVRSILLCDFPYQVFYRRVLAGELRILRIRHARRRPLSWS